ncbi:MAG: Hsp70 family protein [Planctomycetia bacterium]|nr:Hsp70 family protein [Planctomycetia bacterium]
MVAFENGETPIVGIEAYRPALSQPEHTRMDFKLKLGADEVLYTTKSGKKHTATTLSSLVLAKLKRDAESALGRIDPRRRPNLPGELSGPPTTSAPGCRETRRSGGQASGARAQRGGDGLRASTFGSDVFVFDLGGGTFDATVARIQAPNSTCSEPQGCRTSADATSTRSSWSTSYTNSREGRFRARPEPGSRVLRGCPRTHRAGQGDAGDAREDHGHVSARGKYASIEVTRDTFLRLTASLVEQAASTCNDLLQLVGLSWSRIDKLLFVGGAARRWASRKRWKGLRAARQSGH